MHEKTKKVLTGVAALAAAGGLTAGIASGAKDGRDGERRHQQETALTGDAKQKAEAAALAAVPGGKVLRSEEDADGNAKYEVHMENADGEPVDVYLNADFEVVAQREGHRGPHPGGPGHHGEPLTGDAKDKAEAAAKAELPGATIRESFAGSPPFVRDGEYVVHVEKADGSPAAVVLDENFEVLEVLDKPQGGRGMHPRPEVLTGDTATKARDAAKAAVPNGTVRAAFAGAGGGRFRDEAYVVIMERADGRHVIVLLDERFEVVRKLTRPDFGPRGHHGPPHGRPA